MKYVFLASVALYAYSEISILLLNELFMKHCCGFNRWILIKPLHLVTACISLSMASFFYTDTWIPIACIFAIIYLTHLEKTINGYSRHIFCVFLSLLFSRKKKQKNLFLHPFTFDRKSFLYFLSSSVFHHSC